MNRNGLETEIGDALQQHMDGDIDPMVRANLDKGMSAGVLAAPDYRYRIRGLDGVIRHAEPTVGKWYVEMIEDDEAMAQGINGGCRAGQIAEYIGQGEWDDEGSECRMVDHDFLQVQS